MENAFDRPFVMLKEHSSFVKQIIAAIDCLLVLAAFILSYRIVSPHKALVPILNYWVMVIGFTGFYLYFAWTRELFSIMLFNWMRNLLGRIVMIFLSAAMLGAAILYLLPDSQSSRYLYGTFCTLSFMFIFTEKLLLRMLIAHLRRRNRNTTPIIVFGRGRMASQIIYAIDKHPEWGLRVIRKLDISLTPTDFEEVLKSCYVEEIFFCIPRAVSKKDFSIDNYLQVCEEMGRPARVFINISSATSFAQWQYHKFMEAPTLISHTVDLDPDQMLFKRLFDVTGALAGLFILMISLPWLALIIKCTSRGPVFFRQVRVGKNGKRFIMYKLRSMTVDAERIKNKLQELNECEGAIFKIKNDPRVTKIGRFMRKFSLDELPQFINVFKGEMSLVGTRPPTVDEVAQYSKWHHRRISAKPGMTGLWQVSGRNQISNFDEVVKLDLAYIDNWSIFLDIKIIFKTIAVVFSRRHAF
ncbi:MAG: sugar transferase [Chitinispirillaceae bacterium]|nr:sugar transferase [Chitinispirillaceae bacterium]